MKYRMIDLFAGCGGLTEGFMQTKQYEEIAAVEWLRPQVNTLRKRLKTKWGEADSEQRVMHFDIQREEELFSGWNDEEFGKGKGLDYFVEQSGGIDLIIGGPPCQAYSVAGRVRDENGMRDDYRNYLFEHYLNVVNRYRPKFFVFENVPGILSAAPDGTPITELITRGFEGIGYKIISELKNAVVNASDYGVPQNRSRVVILGVDVRSIDNAEEVINKFYNTILPKYRVPPCQAYSVAGRVRDENGMRDDYRNYLFEHYLNVVNRYRPKFFVFENVPGILSAAPDGTPITELITRGFEGIGYKIISELKNAVVNASDYGVPQNRSRVVILGVDVRSIDNAEEVINKFYNTILPKYRVKKKITVREAIGDLPKCMPVFDESSHKKRISHKTPECNITWHIPRYSNLRDMDTFRILEEDIASGLREYDSKKISELYEKKIGSKSPIHRYHVLEPDEPSTTIIAHLYKDGNRFIHYDPEQQRTITVREAARLQSFPDDFEFVGSRGNAYQMIGNAVPPQLANVIAESVAELLKEV